MTHYKCTKDLTMSHGRVIAFRKDAIYEGEQDKNNKNRVRMMGSGFKPTKLGHGVTTGSWLDYFIPVDPITLDEYEDE